MMLISTMGACVLTSTPALRRPGLPEPARRLRGHVFGAPGGVGLRGEEPRRRQPQAVRRGGAQQRRARRVDAHARALRAARTRDAQNAQWTPQDVQRCAADDRRMMHRAQHATQRLSAAAAATDAVVRGASGAPARVPTRACVAPRHLAAPALSAPPPCFSLASRARRRRPLKSAWHRLAGARAGAWRSSARGRTRRLALPTHSLMCLWKRRWRARATATTQETSSRR